MPRPSDASPIVAKMATMCGLLDMSPSSVRRLVKQGALPEPIRLSRLPADRRRWAELGLSLAARDRAVDRLVVAGVARLAPSRRGIRVVAVPGGAR